MEPRSLKLTIKLKKHDSISSKIPDSLKNMEGEPSISPSPNVPGPVNPASPEQVEVSSKKVVENGNKQDEENQAFEDSQKQLVLYDPAVAAATEVEPTQDLSAQRRVSRKAHPFSDQTQRVLPSVGAFTVQCAECFKWRLIPTKEKYEEIREHIIEKPFTCGTAREWRPDVSCDDPPDIEQDGSRLWAIDRPNIAQPPPGWQRLLRIRGEGGSKFADVYYVAPTGKRFRSKVEVEKYLKDHPEYIEQGISITQFMSQFSFQIPRPLQGDYVRKQSTRSETASDASNPVQVKPLAWISPDVDTALQLSGPQISASYFDSSPHQENLSGKKKKKKMTPSKRSYNSDLVCDQNGGSLQEPHHQTALDQNGGNLQEPHDL